MSDKSRPPPIRNHLLVALPGNEYKRLSPLFESIRLPLIEVFYGAAKPYR